MKRITYLFSALVFPFLVMGQTKKFEYTPKVKSNVEISNLMGEITLQNSSGNALVIESDFNNERPERAEGLKPLGSMEDNTDLGININEENGVINIQGATRHVRDFKYKILIPVGTAVRLDYGNPFANGDIVIDSFDGSLEIRTMNSNVKITKSSGPFTVNSLSGNVEVVFDKLNQNEPISLATVNGVIDVTIPGSEKATIEISTMDGNVYNNLDLKSTTPDNDKDSRAQGLYALKHRGGNTYTLNGGGQKLFIKGISNNIYLRKR